jgi:hypothetical protein
MNCKNSATRQLPCVLLYYNMFLMFHVWVLYLDIQPVILKCLQTSATAHPTTMDDGVGQKLQRKGKISLACWRQYLAYYLCSPISSIVSLRLNSCSHEYRFSFSYVSLFIYFNHEMLIVWLKMWQEYENLIRRRQMTSTRRGLWVITELHNKFLPPFLKTWHM